MGRVVYLAGPYRGDVAGNVSRIRGVAIKLWKAGFVVLCPHLNSGGLENEVDEEGILMVGALELMKRCDGVVVEKGGGWEKSAGTLLEMEVARKNGIPVWTWDEGNGIRALGNDGNVALE